MGETSVIRKALTTSSTRRAIMLGCLLQLFQQVAGINTVMYYSAKIISMAGFSDNTQAIWMSAGIASVNFLCTFIGLFLVEKIGRRMLLLGSLCGVCVSLAFLAVGFQLADTDTPLVTIVENQTDPCSKLKVIKLYLFCHQLPAAHGKIKTDFLPLLQDCSACTYDPSCGFCFSPSADSLAANASCVQVDNGHSDFAQYGRCTEQNLAIHTDLTFANDYCPSETSWLIILGLASYLFFFAPGMGPMPWTINSEIYPLWARSFGSSMATSTNWAFNLLISMTFLSLTEAITKQVRNNKSKIST